MTRLAWVLIALLPVTLWAQGKSDTVRDLIKDAASNKADAKPKGDDERPALDVSKMPFTPDSIKAVVAHHQPQIQGCYEEMLAAQRKKVEGELKTSWVVTPEGFVKNAKVERKGTTLKDPKLHECVVAVLSAINFPQPSDQKDHPINYPFKLKAVE